MKKGIAIGVFVLMIVIIGAQAWTVSKRIAAAYLYGYPLILMDRTSQAMLANGPGVNRFNHTLGFPDSSFRQVVRPNNDTLYSSAWLDLSVDAVVLTVPDTDGRYYVMPLMDAWTNVFAMVGPGATGNGAGDYLITGPDWTGDAPQGVEIIAAPTAMVWIIGRIQANGRADIPAIATLQRQFALTPLRKWRNGERDPGAQTPFSQRTRVDPNQAIDAMSTDEFLGELARLMNIQNPLATDKAILEQLAALGVRPGEPFAKNELGVIGSWLGDFVVQFVREKIRQRVSDDQARENGWKIYRGTIGRYGSNYPVRAAIARHALGALPPEEAAYASADADSHGRPLDGAHAYRLYFPPGQTPPAQAFWSLTMYDEAGYLVDNPIDRYTIGDRSDLQFNADGSLEILIQRQRPADRIDNWLPAPAGSFTMLLRIYRPGASFRDSTWRLPEVRRVD